MQVFEVLIYGISFSVQRDSDGAFIIPDEIRAHLEKGSALKPAWEPICLARKPLSEPTVAANVLRWGTGAINVDATRVETGDNLNGGAYSGDDRRRDEYSSTDNDGAVPLSRLRRGIGDFTKPLGRWPANIVHDGSDEVLAAFPDVHSAGAARGEPGGGEYAGGDGWGNIGKGVKGFRVGDDSGSAARFFYSAKADADDRLGSKHPTVKPVDLMQWLCRLVCPPGGMILDPFAGTGTTGEAAWREGFNAVLIEREAEYLADIARRMALCLEGPMVRAHESVKARNVGKPEDNGPLFGGTGLAGGANMRATTASSTSDRPNHRTDRA